MICHNKCIVQLGYFFLNSFNIASRLCCSCLVKLQLKAVEQYSVVLLITWEDIFKRLFTLVPTFFGFVRIDTLLYVFYPKGKSSLNLTPRCFVLFTWSRCNKLSVNHVAKGCGLLVKTIILDFGLFRIIQLSRIHCVILFLISSVLHLFAGRNFRFQPGPLVQ